MPELPNPDQVHREALILDAHADTPQRFADEQWHFTDPLGRGHLNLDSACAGNLAGELFAVWVEPTQWQGRFAHRALTLIDAVHEQLRRHPEMQLCLTAEDILAARAANRFATMISIEGGHAIENSLALLRDYHRLGVRAMTLTWSNSHDWAASSGDTDPANDPGLSPFGHEVIAEMNRLGMLVDVSHASDRTFWDVRAASKAPIIASHSSARALTHSPRNLTDDQLRALAAAGGLACANFYPAFIHEPWRLAWNAQRPEREAAHHALNLPQPIPFHLSDALDRQFSARLGRAPFQSLIDHILHMLAVAGPDHVGIGSDFDGIPYPPQDIDSATHLPRITAALLAHGVPPPPSTRSSAATSSASFAKFRQPPDEPLCPHAVEGVALNQHSRNPHLNKLSTAICLAAICLPLAAQTTPPPAPPADLPDSPTANPQLLPPAVPTGPTVLIDTTMGRLTCKLFTREAPVATSNFIGLAQGTKDWIDLTTQKKRKTRFFDGLTFHRVIPEFMIQGGDPQGDGTGDPGYFFQDEIDPTLTFDQPGRLAMANAGPGPTGSGTNGSQFFITEVPVPQLNGKHTIFGQCDPHTVLLVSSIARVDRDPNDKPRTPVVMNKITIVPDGSPIPPEPAAPPTKPTMPPPVPR